MSVPTESIAPDPTATQAASVFDPYAPWMLAGLLLLAAWGLARRWRRAELRGRLGVPAPEAPLPRLPWAVAAPLLFTLSFLFGLLAWSVTLGTHSALGQFLRRWDDTAQQWAKGLSVPGVHGLAALLTEIGRGGALVLLVGLVALLLLRRRQGFLALAWITACAANGLTVRVLKAFIGRARPPESTEAAFAGLSFPSGHAAGAVMVLGLLVWLLQDWAPPSRRAWWALLGGLLIIGIAVSRVILQAHYMTDVFGGLLLGACSLVLTIAVMEHARRW
ncbi:phosphatase PAP2 family protein [Ottowia thiooxydans]|uniref:Membrane-associated phospholipid phosphatase n=1 Tax=Ottowia thiooxydans TaxID=219182 RepID=A0ABV2QEU7_9BURK